MSTLSKARYAIEALFADTSMSAEAMLHTLEGLADKIDFMIWSMTRDIERAPEEDDGADGTD